jgi:hypothetical protein
MVWNRLYPFWVVLIDSAAIMRENNLHVATLELPVWVGPLLAPMSGVEYEYRIPFIDVLVVTELSKAFDYRGSSRVVIE